LSESEIQDVRRRLAHSRISLSLHAGYERFPRGLRNNSEPNGSGSGRFSVAGMLASTSTN
jgi:hypothetical protein